MNRLAAAQFGSWGRGTISVRQLCSRVDDHSIFVLEEIKKIRVYESNSAIYRRGESATSIFVLLEGRAVLIGHSNKQQLVRPGVLCGLVEALSGEHYPTELTALTPCICSVIERGDLIGFLRRRPSVSLRLCKLISRNYHSWAESAWK